MWGVVARGADVTGPGKLDLRLHILREDALQAFSYTGADALMAVEWHGERAAGDQPVAGVVAEEMQVAMGVGDCLSVRHHGAANIVIERGRRQLPRRDRHDAPRKARGKPRGHLACIGVGGYDQRAGLDFALRRSDPPAVFFSRIIQSGSVLMDDCAVSRGGAGELPGQR